MQRRYRRNVFGLKFKLVFFEGPVPFAMNPGMTRNERISDHMCWSDDFFFAQMNCLMAYALLYNWSLQSY